MNYDFDFSELSTLEKRKKDIECKLKEQKRKEHKAFVKEHKKLLLFFDILMIASVLMNLGAVMMTNVMVVKDNPDMSLYEANPVQSEVHDYVPLEEKSTPFTDTLFFKFLLNAVMWIFVIGSYIHTRTQIRTNTDLMVLTFLTIWVGYLITIDFVNDLGFIIGRWLS